MRAHAVRWSVVPVLALFSLLPQHQANAQLISFGVMAGLSQSKFTGNNLEDARNAGFIAGAFVRVGALGFAVQPGVYYTAKGAKTSDFSETTGVGSKTNLNYIEIPVVLRMGLGPIYVGAGPAIALKLSCNYTAGSAASMPCPDSTGIKSTETTGILEAGISFGKLSVGARADIGISNAIEAIQTGNSSKVSYKTQTVSLVAAVRF